MSYVIIVPDNLTISNAQTHTHTCTCTHTIIYTAAYIQHKPVAISVIWRKIKLIMFIGA